MYAFKMFACTINIARLFKLVNLLKTTSKAAFFCETTNTFLFLQIASAITLTIVCDEEKKKNPFIDALKEDLGVHLVAEAQSKLKHLFAERRALFTQQPTVISLKFHDFHLKCHQQPANNHPQSKYLLKNYANSHLS